MPMDVAQFTELVDDLAAEADELIGSLSRLTAKEWATPTPAAGWNVHDQIVHLAYFDDLVGLGFTDPEGFAMTAVELQVAGDDWVDQLSHDRAAIPPDELLAWFGRSRTAAVELFARLGPAARSPWFGPPMSAASSATARLMETWAHGQDVYDALGVARKATGRIRHICHLGVITRAFSYRLHGIDAPAVDVRVELTADDGSVWAWGDSEAADRVTGNPLDFALVVTQRRNVADTRLRATPGAAAEWMSLAQAFAGTTGTGRPPGQFEVEG
jgi:uncharacterized protein (TIGR03084 family)